MQTVLLLLLASPITSLISAQQVIQETACGDVSELGIVVPSNRLTGGGLESIARNTLRTRAEDGLVFAVFGSSQKSVIKSVRQSEVRIGLEPPQGIVSDQPERALRRIQRAVAGIDTTAAMLRIRSDAILVSPTGRVQLAGKIDPMITKPGYKLLHISLFKPPSAALGAAKHPCHLTMYFSGDEDLSSAGAAELQGRYQRLFPAAELLVKVRRDGWFLDDENYPDLPILPGPMPLPDLRGWRTAPQIVCSTPGWPRELKPNCSILRSQ